MILTGLYTAAGLAAVLSQDNFTDGNFTAAEGANGLTWTVVSGAASIVSNRLGVRQNRSLVTADQTVSAAEFTITFDAWITWSARGRLVFLYKDSLNYYAAGLGGDPGIYRVLNGTATRLWADPGSILRLPHLGSATASFKIYVKREAAGITILADKSGDGVDYDVELIDTAAAALAAFTGAVKLGGQTTDTSGTSTSFSLDNIVVHDVQVLNPRAPLTYYVDAVNGDDSRSDTAAQNLATPWKTIQKAATAALAGDVVKVLPGTYRENVTVAHSGSRTAPITFQANDPQDRPVMEGSEIVSTSGWQSASITDFNGITRAVQKAPLAWLPAALYQDTVRMFESQWPNQTDPDDQYDLDSFRTVPGTDTSKYTLTDPAFFTQPQDDYWVGAELLIHDGFPNAIGVTRVIAYRAAEHRIYVNPIGGWIGPDRGRADKYALRNHRGLIDRPGEFYVDTLADEVYVWPYAGRNLTDISAGKYTNAFTLSSGNRYWTVIDGFRIRFYNSTGIYISGGCNHHVVRNCEAYRNMGSGVGGRDVQDILVDHCYLHSNYDNGTNFGAGRDYTVSNCEITANGNNGVWFGTGGGAIFNAIGIHVNNNYIHHQGGRRAHPDNYQMHQCKDIFMDGNVYVQDGHQNMWCQYTDNYRLTNNIFMGGPLGIGSAMHSFLYHNVFYGSGLRYDAHLDDASAPAPTGDYYKPQSAIIRNNLIVQSSISWPSATLVDRHQAFAVDHNYFNIESSYTYSGWDWNGYMFGADRGKSLVATTQKFGAACTWTCEARNTWSNPTRLVVLYADAQNYYSIGMGGAPGVFRTLNGVETRIWADSQSRVRLPHASPSVSNFIIQTGNAGGIITLKIDRVSNGAGGDADLADTLGTAAAAVFLNTGVGLADTTTAAGSPSLYIDNVQVLSGAAAYADSFEDGNYTAAEGANGLTWTVVSGAARLANKGGSGVGFGAGSIIDRDNDSLARMINQMPDSLYTTYDFHLPASSPLRNAGINAWVPEDKDGNVRFMGTAVDIGPYEYIEAIGINDQVPAVRAVRAARPLVLLYPNPVKSSAIIRLLENNTPLTGTTMVRLYSADGQLAQELTVEHGQALVSADQLKGGMYIVRHQEKTIGKIIVVK
jgi:hypothetical protein